MSVIRLIHVSDIHVTAPAIEWRRVDWFNKRLTSWFNLRCLGRGRRFAQADAVMAALAQELRRNSPAHVIFSGDATALGFESELRRAAQFLNVGQAPGLAVPGNHDYCTRPAAASGLFERYFAPWQTGLRVDDHTYPFAQRVGQAWLIGVNSCTGNLWPWDASGAVDRPQLERLGRLFQTLAPGPRILVTHYPVALADGKPEKRAHGLRNLDDLIAVAVAGNVSLWLHGHRHGFYHHRADAIAPFPVLCAGSTTQTAAWSCGDYTLDGFTLHVQRRVFDPDKQAHGDAESFELTLPGGHS